MEIINDLTAEGFRKAAIRQAMRLAAERDAKGRELLPHLIREVSAFVEAQAAEIAELSEAEREKREAEFQDELAAVEKLPKKERARSRQGVE